jgi:hypothetical protein
VMFRDVLAFLNAVGWPVEPAEYDGLPCIRTRFIGTDEAWDCRARPYDPFGQLAFESILPFTVPAENRSALLELVARANWRLLTGAFQLDLDTGAMVFRTMVFLSHGATPTEELLRGLVYGNVLTVDRCLAQFGQAAAGADPTLAFARLAL